MRGITLMLIAGVLLAAHAVPPPAGIPRQEGEETVLVARGELAGYAVAAVRGARDLRHPTGVVWQGQEATVATRKGLFTWNPTLGRLSRRPLHGAAEEPTTGLASAAGLLLVGTEQMGTLAFAERAFRQIRIAPEDARSYDYQAQDGEGTTISGSLVGLVGRGDFVVGAWRQEGLLASRAPHRMWEPVPVPGEAAAVPTSLVMDDSGHMVCGLKGRERGFLIHSSDYARSWQVVPDFRDVPISAAFVGPGKVMVGIERGGAVLADLEAGRSWPVGALSEAGRINSLAPWRKVGAACGTDEGFVLLSPSFKREGRIGAKEGVAGGRVLGVCPFSSYGKEGFILWSESRSPAGGGGLTVLSRP